MALFLFKKEKIVEIIAISFSFRFFTHKKRKQKLQLYNPHLYLKTCKMKIMCTLASFLPCHITAEDRGKENKLRKIDSHF